MNLHAEKKKRGFSQSNEQAQQTTHNRVYWTGKPCYSPCVSSNRLTGKEHSLVKQPYDFHFDAELRSEMLLKPIMMTAWSSSD